MITEILQLIAKILQLIADLKKEKKNLSKCPINSHCINNRGSYTCECDHGFHVPVASITGANPISGTSPTGSTIICEDMDECNTPSFTSDCDVNAVCINTRGSYKCQCKTGYEANSYDGTEGTVPFNLTDRSISPKKETQGTVKGLVCNDINECEARRDNCPQYSVCENNDGSFTCYCPAGFQSGSDELSNPTCDDINEEMIKICFF